MLPLKRCAMPDRSERTSVSVRSGPPVGFGPKTHPILAERGILTQAHLDEADPLELYLRCKRYRPGTSLNMSYGMIASQERVHWREVAVRRAQLDSQLRRLGL